MPLISTILNLLLNKTSSHKAQFFYEETCDLDKGFAIYFEENLRDEFKKMENQRLLVFKQVRIRLMISIFLFFLVTALLGAVIGTSLSLSEAGNLLLPGTVTAFDFIHFLNLSFYIIFLTSALLYWTFIPSSNLNSNLKQVLLPQIISFIPKCQLTQNTQANENLIFKSMLFPSLQRLFGRFEFLEKKHRSRFTIQTEDNIKGEYKETSYSLGELKIKKLHSENYEIAIFRGYLAIIECKKRFKGQTIVSYNSNFFFNFYYKLKYQLNGLKITRLEDPEFNKIFRVHSTDQIEARYLLTPTFMDRLYRFATLYKKHNVYSTNLIAILLGLLFKLPIELIGHIFPSFSAKFSPTPLANKASIIQCSFYNNQIIIAAPCMNDLFEFKILDQPINSKAVSTIFQELKIIYDLIDELKLHQDIGL